MHIYVLHTTLSQEIYYKKELDEMLACGALTGLHIALSREPTIMPKTYVQDLIKQACATLASPLAALATQPC